MSKVRNASDKQKNGDKKTKNDKKNQQKQKDATKHEGCTGACGDDDEVLCTVLKTRETNRLQEDLYGARVRFIDMCSSPYSYASFTSWSSHTQSATTPASSPSTTSSASSSTPTATSSSSLFPSSSGQSASTRKTIGQKPSPPMAHSGNAPCSTASGDNKSAHRFRHMEIFLDYLLR